MGRGGLVLAVCLCWAGRLGAAPAASQPAPTRPAATQPAGAPAGAPDELLLFADVPVVVSASRTPQPVNWLAMPVSVITDEDIHYSGLTSIPEILLAVPGMDVLPADRNHVSVGVRGFHDWTANRTLSLIDGRDAGQAGTGQLNFTRWPILVEDIKRIEVLRGPAGAMWGSNAMNGVINVIMKEPEECLGWLASTTWNQFGDSYSHLRWAAKQGRWSWRVSLGYEGYETSEDAIDDDSFTSFDFARNFRFDSKAVYQVEPRTKLSFGLGASHVERGRYNDVDLHPSQNSQLETFRPFVRLDREFDNGAAGYVQWSGQFEGTDEVTGSTYSSARNDLEAQYSFRPSEKHQITVGGNFRAEYLDSRGFTPQYFVFPDNPFLDFSSGAFLVDRWQVTDRLTLEGQIRVDYSSPMRDRFDWAGRGTALYALDDAKRHVLRASVARSFRSPGLDLREMVARRILLPSPPFPPDSFAVNVNGNPDLRNEQSWAYELGYTGQLTERLSLRVDGYFQQYRNLIGVTWPAPGSFAYGLGDSSSAGAWGGEAELAWKSKWLRLSAWYAYNDSSVEYGQRQDIRSYRPAPHKIGATGRVSLPDDWTINVLYRFTGVTPGDPIEMDDVNSTSRLDIAVTKALPKLHSEFQVGVSDVLDTGSSLAPGVLKTGGNELPGRTFFIRYQVRF
jgi:iron complex outermembrane receptor protein